MAEKVWTMMESRVYHARRDCPSLVRLNRWHEPMSTTVEKARVQWPGHRRPCKLCFGGTDGF